MTADILHFPAPPEWVRAELDGGVVTNSDCPELVGRRRYFIDLIDASGARIGVWDGASYEDALRELAECEREGIEAFDLVAPKN